MSSGKMASDEPLAALEGGPRSNWWYTVADLRLLQDSVRRLPAEHADVAHDLLGYEPTKAVVTHPVTKYTGTVWRHKDGVAAAPARGGRR